jgi:hypothetical protein
MDHCVELIRDVQPIAPHLHVAPLCKPFLADLLPNAVGTVMFVDNDVVTVQNPGPCFQQVDPNPVQNGIRAEFCARAIPHRRLWICRSSDHQH